MPAISALEALPTSGLTVSALRALDFVAPGAWTNPTSFNAMLAEVSGQSQPNVLAQIRQRATMMDLANTSHTAEALRIYGLTDTADQVAAGAAAVSKITDMLGGLGGLGKLAPKPETTQAVDAGIKLVAEMLAFGMLHGFPTADANGIGRFTGALVDYGRYDLIRVTGWIVFDGLIPLGPDFVGKLSRTFSGLASDDLLGNPVFKAVASRLPGGGAADKRDFVLKTVNQTGDWVTRFVTERGLSRDKAMGALKGVLPGLDLGGDALGAAIDASTAYFSHTGTQTVARSLARQATDALRDDVWSGWVKSQG